MNKTCLLLLPLLLAACASVPEPIIRQPSSVAPPPQPLPPPADGAIFHAASYRPVFEDRRARAVGDVLTVVINEKTSATKSADDTGSKTASSDSSITRLFKVPAATLSGLGSAGSTANSYEDKGGASSSNSFSGTISVTVIDVQPNGNLVVSGEKQVAFDKGTEFVRFSGVVNPTSITAGNVVTSTQVADARFEYRTNTRIDKTELMSSLARFFLSVAPW